MLNQCTHSSSDLQPRPCSDSRLPQLSRDCTEQEHQPCGHMHLGHGPSSMSEIFEGYQCYEFELHFQFYNVMDYDGASSQWLNNMLRQRLTQRQLHEIIQPTAITSLQICNLQIHYLRRIGLRHSCRCRGTGASDSLPAPALVVL